MLSALIKAPDCFATVMTLLDPRELQNMRSASKEIFKGITKKVMLQCINSTIARYAGPHAMPDGAVRLYSPFGHRPYDIYKVEDEYQLKMHGFKVQKYMERQGDDSKIKLHTLLSHSSSRLTNIYFCNLGGNEMTHMTFSMNITDTEPKFYDVFFHFDRTDSEESERGDSTRNFHYGDFTVISRHYEYLLDTHKPTLLQQLFEAKDKISALEQALQTLLADAERRAARVGN